MPDVLKNEFARSRNNTNTLNCGCCSGSARRATRLWCNLLYNLRPTLRRLRCPLYWHTRRAVYGNFAIIQNLNSLGSTANSTQFYILSNRDTDLPQEVSCDFRVKALIRMSAPRPSCQSDSKQNIVPYLMALDLPSAHISRRPSLVPIPFYSVYFVEVFGRHDQTRETWKVYLEEAMYRVRALGCEVDLIGVW